MKPSSRTLTRLVGVFAAAGGVLGATAVTAPFAQAAPTACRDYPYYSSYKGIAVRPCINYAVNVDGSHDDAWRAEAWVLSPQTDIRFYVQVGTSQTRTSPITWDGSTNSQVVGPSPNWQYIAPPNGFFFVPSSVCYWARVWATDGGTTVVWDVESPSLNC
ncbi:hypothetical protein GCM10029978_112300 [Actinoallomurus acanthiterrae]